MAVRRGPVSAEAWVVVVRAFDSPFQVRATGWPLYNPGMPRFSLRELFLSVTLIALGLGMLACGGQLNINSLPSLCLWLIAWPMIGAGVFAPFKRPMWGAVVGVLLQLVYLLVMFV